ncbi:MAG: hypothetical protein ACR2PI_26570 [Hyphomicrobiaceae bacterium]
MNRLLMIATVLTIALHAPSATAQSDNALTPQTAPVSYSAIPAPSARATGNLLRRIQSYGCRVCRRGCVRDFKIDCYESDRWCRRQFVRCMRECWEFVCR